MVPEQIQGQYARSQYWYVQNDVPFGLASFEGLELTFDPYFNNEKVSLYPGSHSPSVVCMAHKASMVIWISQVMVQWNFLQTGLK